MLLFVPAAQVLVICFSVLTSHVGVVGAQSILAVRGIRVR